MSAATRSPLLQRRNGATGPESDTRDGSALPGRRYTLADRLHVTWPHSLTASLNARFRARETLRPDGVLADPWAAELAGDHLVLRLLARLEGWIPAVARTAAQQATAHCVRHAAIDARARDALAEGFAQMVVVGAGYDMRAARLGGAARWFEVDRPAMAAHKAARLAGRGPAVARVPLAVGEGPLLPALEAAGWDPAQSTCFIVEGLLHYLDRPHAEALLDAMAQGPGPRRVVLSFIEPSMSRRVTPLYRELTRLLGEIPRTFFGREELAERFGRVGLRFTAWDAAEQVRRFAPSAAGREAGLTQVVGEAG